MNLVYKKMESFANESCLPLHDAVYKGDGTLVKRLLQSGENGDVLNKHFESPLHIAVKKCDIKIVKLLVDHGCDVNICENFAHVTPLHFAVNAINDVQSFHDILLLLLKGGCHLNWGAYSSLQTPFFRAVDLQKSKIAALLLKYGADPTLGSPFDITSLHKLCQNGDSFLINVILHCKVNWNRETWLSDRFSDDILPLYDTDIVQTIQSSRFRVTSLKNLCRASIRNLFDEFLYSRVTLLPLPTKLKEFILLNDLI